MPDYCVGLMRERDMCINPPALGCEGIPPPEIIWGGWSEGNRTREGFYYTILAPDSGETETGHPKQKEEQGAGKENLLSREKGLRDDLKERFDLKKT